ncbi:uncharacterized protein LOC107844195 [Capsicum annuum]|uniref:uncharacterized protein LOC107844195 n=1 Tax=Capsicum annuum TaxID=4072 RepID=UPI0007BF5A8E|nr:uncharacterized protein LOC107844195 [Capsicum annuum]
MQLGKFSQAQNNRPQGGFPSDTENPNQGLPKYANYLKDVITNKTNLQGIKMLSLTKECSLLVMRKIPKKLKDPWIFTFLFQIGDNDVVHALRDLGESLNFITLSVSNILGLGKLRPCSVVLEMANRTRVHPDRIIEDVLVKVVKFIILVDFIILDYEADNKVRILECPFFAIEGSQIDVRESTLKVRLDDEEVVFKLYLSLYHTLHNKDLHDYIHEGG